LARHVTVVTPENIPLTLELAGLGTRFGALLIDMLIQSLVTFTLAIIGGILAAVNRWSDVGNIFWALVIAAVFLIWFGYFILFESIWNGQTPGKRAFGLRVVCDGGYPINFFATATRNLIRIADFLPMNYAVGALSVFFQPQYKRLGDLVAGTIVVKEPEAQALAAFEASGVQRVGLGTPMGGGSPSLPEGVRNPFDVLNGEELTLLRGFATRRWQMTSDDSERLAYRLVVPLIPRLNLSFMPGVAPRYADLASALVAAADNREAELDRVR